MSDTVERVLAAHRFLDGMPEGTVELIAGCAQLDSFEPGQRLLAEGEPAGTLFLVHHGRVGIEVHQSEGIITIETVGPGQIVGLSWASPPFRWQFDARALEPVSVVAVDVDRLRTELRRRPDIGVVVLERLASLFVDRLQETRLRVLDLHALGDDRPR